MLTTQKLINRLSEKFSSSIIKKGNIYFHNDKVHIIHDTDQLIKADVYGSFVYNVTIQVDNLGFHASCDCSYFSKGYGGCKHIWATILQTIYNKMNIFNTIHSLNILFDQDITKNNSKDNKQNTTNQNDNWQKTINKVQQNFPVPYSYLSQKTLSKKRLIYVIDAAHSFDIGNIYLSVYYQKQKKDRLWTTLKQRKFELSELKDKDDIKLLGLLKGASTISLHSSFHQHNLCDCDYHIPPSLYNSFLPVACQTERLFICSHAGSTLFKLKWDNKSVFQFKINISEKNDDNYLITACFIRDNEIIQCDVQLLAIYDNIFFTKNSIYNYTHNHCTPWINFFKEYNYLYIPKRDLFSFISQFYSTTYFPDLILDVDIQCVIKQGTPQKILRIEKLDDNSASLIAKIYFDYKTEEILSDDPRRSLINKKKKHIILRDIKKEKKAYLQLLANDLKSVPNRHNQSLTKHFLLIPASNFHNTFISKLIKLGWRIEAFKQQYHNASNFSIEVKSNIDWFELHGKCNFGDISISIPQLLKSLKKGSNFIQLNDGSKGILPEKWLQKYQFLFNLGNLKKEHIQFKISQGMLLDLFLKEQKEVKISDNFQRWQKEMDNFKQIIPIKPAKHFIGKLRNYQKEGVGWLNFLHKFRLGGCLADDMGLGKTVQVLSFLQNLKSCAKKQTSLIIVPRSLLFNWQEEVIKFTPDLSVYIHRGINRKTPGKHFFNYNLILTTYGTLRRDIKDFKNIQFFYIILDESQAIKNASSLTSKSARLLQADYRLAMSGTPVENHIGELWSLFEFLNPGFLGTISSFKKAISAGHNNEILNNSINKIIKPFILRRTKKEVAKDLPKKVEQTIFCEMQDKQKKDYLKLQKYYQSNLLNTIQKKGLNKSKIHVLEALLRLRQVACHSALIDKSAINANSAKLDILLESLKEIITEGSKALVFSQFTSFLSIIKKKLKKENIPYLYLDGKTNKRQTVVEQFQNDNIHPVFLISLKAGGLGLNLTRAPYVFLLDPWWNPAVEAQAIDRAHRIGQTKTVFAYRLITKDSVEEKILELQQKKKQLADSIITSDNNILKNLNVKDLEFLLS